LTLNLIHTLTGTSNSDLKWSREEHVLVLNTLLDREHCLGRIRIADLHHQGFARRQSWGVKLKSQDGDLCEPALDGECYTFNELHTLGPVAAAPVAPGVIPRLAFQRFKLSSSASRFAKWSTVAGLPTL
jgi:hypothetical protein